MSISDIGTCAWMIVVDAARVHAADAAAAAVQIAHQVAGEVATARRPRRS